MKQKLIITLWKAQLSTPLPSDSIYCLLAYNAESKTSKHIQSRTSLEWKETFVFSLAKDQLALKLDFIPLKKNQQIHFAHDNLAETLSVAKATMNISVKAPTKGPLPAKLDIVDEQTGNSLGKVFIEYEVLKTEVAYLVQKMLDYNYILKLSSFTVTFLRQLKKTPTFYLKLKYGEKIHQEEFPFQQEKGQFTYAYPIKLYMGKEMDLAIELEVKDFFGLDYQSAHESIKSGGLSEKRSDGSTLMARKKDTIIDVSVESKIVGLMDLAFRENTKTTKRVPLTTVMKNQSRDIGSIEFQLEAIFKTPQQKQAIEEQKRGLVQKSNPEVVTERKKKPSNTPNLQQSNGFIMLNTIMGRLQIGSQLGQKIQGKNLSLTLKLGKQVQESTVLENPGSELIFLDTFTFKRTWEETIKFTIDFHDLKGVKIPMFNSSVNLRELFEMGRIHSKKVKIFDEERNYCGTFILDMEYQQEEKKQKQGSGSREKKMMRQGEGERKSQEKREKIAKRMRQRQEEKKYKVENSATISLSKERDFITMAEALDLKDLILPPLKSRKANSEISKELRYSTISPRAEVKKEKFRSANVYNSNGAIKFSRSPRFQSSQDKSGGSFTLIRESDFDVARKKGTFIGYGDKYDFTREVKQNPGIGKYQIPSLWDKYH